MFKLNTLKIACCIIIIFKRSLIKYVLALSYVQMKLQHAGLLLANSLIKMHRWRSLYQPSKFEQKWRRQRAVEHTEAIRRLLRTNCLSVFDHFVGLTLKGLRFILSSLKIENVVRKMVISI